MKSERKKVILFSIKVIAICIVAYFVFPFVLFAFAIMLRMVGFPIDVPAPDNYISDYFFFLNSN